MTKITRIKPIDFRDKAAVAKEIENFARKYAYADVEHALEISPDGNAYSLTGTKYNVNSEIIGREALRGSISIHNHTIFTGENKGDSFSDDDLTFAIKNNTGKQYLISGERRNAFQFIKSYNEEEFIEAWSFSQKKIWQKHLDNRTQPIFIFEEIIQDLNLWLEGFEFYEKF